MGRPVHADGQRTRQAILEAALQLFADRGYFGTSLRDIARTVGIRESGLYNYFAGKEALFEALILEERQRKEETFAAVVDEPIRDVRATLTELAVLALEQFSSSQQQQLFCILMSDGIRLARQGRINLFERMSSGHTRLLTLMRRLIRERHLRRADPQLLAMAFVGPLLVWRHLRASESPLPMVREPRAFARRHVDQFLSGAALRSKNEKPARGLRRDTGVPGGSERGSRGPRESRRRGGRGGDSPPDKETIPAVPPAGSMLREARNGRH